MINKQTILQYLKNESGFFISKNDIKEVMNFEYLPSGNINVMYKTNDAFRMITIKMENVQNYISKHRDQLINNILNDE